MAEAGWYPDPHNPSQQRYWNGSTWTEHVHVHDVGPASGRPPFTPPPSGPPAVHGGGRPLNDIGQWLRSSARVAWRKLGVCFVLTLLGLVPLVLVVALVVAALFDLDVTGDQIRGFGGFDVALLVAAGLVALGSVIWFGVITIAQHRVLYDAHRDRTISLGDALAVGRRNIGRLIVAYLIVYGIGLVILAGIVGVAALAAFSFSSASEEMIERALRIYNIVSALSWPLSLWLTVKLAFIPVAAAVAPRDNGLVRISMRASNGRFWAVLGRMVLLSLLVGAVFIPLLILLGVVIAAAAVTADSAGGVGAVVFLVVLSGLVAAVVVYFAQVFQMSAVSRLYADLRGPVAD